MEGIEEIYPEMHASSAPHQLLSSYRRLQCRPILYCSYSLQDVRQHGCRPLESLQMCCTERTGALRRATTAICIDILLTVHSLGMVGCVRTRCLWWWIAVLHTVTASVMQAFTANLQLWTDRACYMWGKKHGFIRWQRIGQFWTRSIRCFNKYVWKICYW